MNALFADTERAKTQADDNQSQQATSGHSPINDNMYTCGTPTSDDMEGDTPRSAGSKRRKTSDNTSIEISLGAFMKEANLQMGSIAKTITQPEVESSSTAANESSRRSALFGSLAAIPDLTLDEQIRATRYLTNNINDMDVYWSMNGEARSRFVKMVLSGEF